MPCEYLSKTQNISCKEIKGAHIPATGKVLNHERFDKHKPCCEFLLLKHQLDKCKIVFR